jgi:hypothetical protein
MPVGIATAYDLTTGVKVNMDDVIYTLDPLDTPLLGGIGSDGMSIISSAPVDEIQFFWMHEPLLVPRSTFFGAVLSTDTFITLANATEQQRFSTGDVIRAVKTGAFEVMRITGYGTTANTLLTTRGYAGSTAAAFSSGDQIIGVGSALAEGSAPENARTIDRAQVSNFTQIFGPTKVSLSRTEQRVSKYGVTSEFDRQTYNRLSEQAVAREAMYLYGLSTNDTSNKIRTSSGIFSFLTTNVDATSTILNVANIQTNQTLCYNQGGLPDRLIVNPASLKDLNDTTNVSIVRQTIEDPRRGRIPVMEVWTEFGPLTVVRHRWCHKFHGFLIKRDGVVRRVLDAPFMEKLAKVGDRDELQVVCEEGLEVKGQQHMALMSALVY